MAAAKPQMASLTDRDVEFIVPLLAAEMSQQEICNKKLALAAVKRHQACSFAAMVADAQRTLASESDEDRRFVERKMTGTPERKIFWEALLSGKKPLAHRRVDRADAEKLSRAIVAWAKSNRARAKVPAKSRRSLVECLPGILALFFALRHDLSPAAFSWILTLVVIEPLTKWKNDAIIKAVKKEFKRA